MPTATKKRPATRRVTPARPLAPPPPAPVSVIEPDPEDFEELDLEALEERERKERAARLRAWARANRVPLRLAMRAQEQEVPLERCIGLELFNGVPVFRTPPDELDPVVRLIDLRLLSAPQLAEWLGLQGSRQVFVAPDPQERPGPDGATYLDVRWNQVPYRVRKGGMESLPWPIADEVLHSQSLEDRKAQFAAWKPGTPV